MWRLGWIVPGLAVAFTIVVILAALDRGGQEILRSSVASPISLRKIASIPLTSSRPAGTSVQKVAWSPDGRHLALVLGWGYEVLVLDSTTWREVSRISWQTFQPERGIAFLSNAEVVTMPDDNEVDSPMILAVYNSDTGQLIREMPKPPIFARQLAFAVTSTWDGQFIVTVQSSGIAGLFDGRSGRFIAPVATPPGSSTTAIEGGPAGRLALSVGTRGGRALTAPQKELYIVEAPSNHVSRIIRGHVPGIASIAWSPDAKMIASGASMLQGPGDGNWIRDSDPIRIWDVSTGKMISSFAGVYDPISRIAWHPASEILATLSAKGAGERGTAVRLWSVVQKTMLFEHTTTRAGMIRGLTFHPLTGHLIWERDGILNVFEMMQDRPS